MFERFRSIHSLSLRSFQRPAEVAVAKDGGMTWHAAATAALDFWVAGPGGRERARSEAGERCVRHDPVATGLISVLPLVSVQKHRSREPYTGLKALAPASNGNGSREAMNVEQLNSSTASSWSI